MPALTDPQIKTALAATLKTAEGSLQAYWGEIITWANALAQAQIRQALTDNGFSATQADNWDNFGAYNESIALYWCGIRGRALISKEQAASLNALNLLPQIVEMGNIDIGGIMIFPVPVTLRVRHGSLENPATGRQHNPLVYRKGECRPRIDF